MSSFSRCLQVEQTQLGLVRGSPVESGGVVVKQDRPLRGNDERWNRFNLRGGGGGGGEGREGGRERDRTNLFIWFIFCHSSRENAKKRDERDVMENITKEKPLIIGE